jgi:monoamine oxidase
LTTAIQVKHGMEGVEVFTRTGAVHGSVVIVTVPLHVLQTASVEFDPPLPDSKVQAIHGLAMGTQIRVMLRFAARFWPEGKYCLGYTSEQRGEWPEYFSATFEEDTTDADTLFAIISGEYALGMFTPLALGSLMSIR